MGKKIICMICAAMVLLTGCQKQAAENSEIESSIQQPEESQDTQIESSAVLEESSEASEAEPEESSEEESIVEDTTVEDLLASMTIEEKVGQLFFARFPGTSSAPWYASEYHLGGYVLFAVDFEGESEQSVIDKINACQDVSPIPMLMGVDEEGGTVTRVSDYFRYAPFAAPRDVYAEGGWNQIVLETREKCELLKGFGLNVNLAPVCDLAGDPYDFMYSRSFGDDPEETSQFVSMTVDIMNQMGVGAALKHFPGYGDNADTHTGIAIDEREQSQFYQQDFLPFEAGIEAGVGSVLVSHNIVNCFDDEMPASLSKEVHRILREELSFDGVIMTDDLSMGAILDYCGETNAAVLAIEAGNDLLISTAFEEQYQSIMNAIDNGQISEERIDESVRRVLRFKQSLGLI